LLVFTGVTTRVPFPQPTTAAIVSFASQLIWAGILVLRRATQHREPAAS
jgi:hypothetical protein